MNKKPGYTLVKPDPATDSAYVELEAQNKQLTWLIQAGDVSVGIAWINLEGDEYIDPPHVYVMVDEAHRGRGIGSGVLKEMIRYAYCNLTSEIMYSRQRTDDSVTGKLNKKLGFESDEKPYTDENGLQWQNVKLIL